MKRLSENTHIKSHSIKVEAFFFFNIFKYCKFKFPFMDHSLVMAKGSPRVAK